MEEFKNLILDKFDKLDNKIDNIDKTLVRQEESIKYHIQRTDLLQKQTEKIETEIEPMKKHTAMVEGIIKFFGIIALFLSVAGGLAKFFNLF